ncbi:hypothetical protein WJX72_007004 [[Myrmecia] bisecta]|uniref:Uncharacterized protein n=1 Tax=[Myrmecia] bisecta TaxID=41462 RepID=A0AAW1R8F8_9CHLO
MKEDVYAKAVAENRMTTVEETTIKKTVGLLSALGTAIYVAHQGVKGANPAGVAFGSAWSLTLIGQGLRSQCGSALRLRWVPNRPGKGEWPAPAHHPFIRKKRRQVLTNFLMSAGLGLAVGTAVGIAGGKTREAAAISAAKGAAIDLGMMFAISMSI